MKKKVLSASVNSEITYAYASKFEQNEIMDNLSAATPLKEINKMKDIPSKFQNTAQWLYDHKYLSVWRTTGINVLTTNTEHEFIKTKITYPLFSSPDECLFL